MRAFPARLPRSITDFLKDKSGTRAGATRPPFFFRPFSDFFEFFDFDQLRRRSRRAKPRPATTGRCARRNDEGNGTCGLQARRTGGRCLLLRYSVLSLRVSQPLFLLSWGVRGRAGILQTLPHQWGDGGAEGKDGATPACLPRLSPPSQLRHP